MTDPVLHVLAGPNGAGKSTLFTEVLGPVTHLEFVNADVIAHELWPGDELVHAYEAAEAAHARRMALIEDRVSFVTETVFSHASKLDLLATANAARYLTTLHVIAVPVELSVARVRIRARLGGHDVPEAKVRERYERLWELISRAIDRVDAAFVYDNSSADWPFRVCARFTGGVVVGDSVWPAWAARELRNAGR